MQLEQVTPLILTYNEAPNIRRTLERLAWAKQIVVIDSFSTDDTLQIVREFSNTLVVQRAFDNHAKQWNFGLSQLQTEWALSLDADHLCPATLPGELATLIPACSIYFSRFHYSVMGKRLRSCLYPAKAVLFRTAQFQFITDGHTQMLRKGTEQVGSLQSIIDHDDNKPLSRWLKSQAAYASLEADKLLSTDSGMLGWKDRIRRWIVLAPVLTVVYCLFGRLLILDGKAGLYYTLQRAYAELLLSLELLDRKLRVRQDDNSKRR